MLMIQARLPQNLQNSSESKVGKDDHKISPGSAAISFGAPGLAQSNLDNCNFDSSSNNLSGSVFDSTRTLEQLISGLQGGSSNSPLREQPFDQSHIVRLSPNFPSISSTNVGNGQHRAKFCPECGQANIHDDPKCRRCGQDLPALKGTNSSEAIDRRGIPNSSHP